MVKEHEMMKFITATTKDIKDVIKIRLAYLDEYNNGIDKHKEENLKINMRHYLENNINKDCFVVLAYDGEKVVASAILNIIERVPSIKLLRGRYGEIYGVYTMPDYRNKGIATTLIQMMIRLSETKNLSYVKLDASNLGVPIYKKCGFKFVNDEYQEMKCFFNKES